MNGLISALTSADTLTNNGAVTNSTTDSALLDFFSIAGSLRSNPEKTILSAWQKAYIENSELALRMLLWIRDCRGGAGERRTFRIIYNNLDDADRRRIMVRIPEIGRWDDIWGGTQQNKRTQKELSTQELSFIADNLSNGLLCKWLPRSGVVFDSLASYLKISHKELRARIVKGTKVVEQQMSARKWSEINYPSVPSRAISIYAKAFTKRDPSRFSDYISKVKSGESKINASTLFPYDVLLSYNKNKSIAELQWKALPEYSSGKENILVVADVSASMGRWDEWSLRPIHASISLAMYCSERNNGAFKDCFITFSEEPELQKLTGSFQDRIHQLSSSKWQMNTNLEAVFDLILEKAKNKNVATEEMPTKIIIISDMEFDTAIADETNYESIKLKYSQSNYTMPALVFWNVNGRPGNCPVKITDSGTALVSGYSPSIIPSILGNTSPYEVMMKTIMKEKYAC